MENGGDAFSLATDIPIRLLNPDVNDNTGGNVTVTVLGTYVSCTVPDNTTLFCGRFVAGTYDVYVVSPCGSTTVSKIYAGGPQTTRIFCINNTSTASRSEN